MPKPLKNLIILGTTVVVIGGFLAIVHYAPNKSPFFQMIDDKLKSIITPNPPIGNISPVRDLRGHWKSSLTGKGVQVFGKFTVETPQGAAITTVYEDGDMELIIETVENNTASGQIRYYNLCASATVTAPKVGPITTKKCLPDSGFQPISIRVSGSALDFGTVTVEGATITMQGSYLTDIISGSMTASVPPYGELKGVFGLMRQRE